MSASQGVGVRVFAGGSWGFACTSRPEKEAVLEAVDLAVRIAHASARVQVEPVELAPAPGATGKYATTVKKDPFAVPLEEKLDFLLACDSAMREAADIKVSSAEMVCEQEEKVFANTEGAATRQTFTRTGAGISAVAVAGEEAQRRSFPCSFGRDMRAAGYEYVESLPLLENAASTAKEAEALLTAPRCPSETTTLILDSSQLALQLHESCGHPIELDRVFGTEASYAGTSFLTPEKLDSFRYGSDVVTIVADSTLEGGLGTFGWDDEGVPAQPVIIVENGIFKGYLTSRETAARLGLVSNGTMRASGWDRIPLIRMTNINLEPGDWTLEEMLADTRDGILMEVNTSWSIDDKRINFQFGTEVGRRIENGSVVGLLRNCTYTGITEQFWGKCDAIGNANTLRLWGLPNCGKGEPTQSMNVGHRTPVARFREVRVGVMK